MGSYMGVSGKARNDTKGYFGVAGKARKVVKAYIGDTLGKARLWFSSALPGSGKLGIHFSASTASTTHYVQTSDDGMNFDTDTVTLSTASTNETLSYIRGIDRWVVARNYVTSDDKLNGVLNYSSEPYSGYYDQRVVDGYRFKTVDNSTNLTVYKINSDLSETQIGTVPLITSFPTYMSWFMIDVASDGNGTFCCAFRIRGERASTGDYDYDYESTYVSFVIFTISNNSVTLQKAVRNTATTSTTRDKHISPECNAFYTGEGFLVYGDSYRYNPSTDTFTASNRRLYYASKVSPYSESTITLPTMQSDAQLSKFQGRANDEYVYCWDGYAYYRKNKTNGALTDITSTLKVPPTRSDGDYLYERTFKDAISGVWSVSRAKPGDAAATVITTSAPVDGRGQLAYKDQDGTYQQY